MHQDILSVGIDVGTTTSQVIFSRLTLESTAAVSRMPQIRITKKDIIYRSPVYMTPLSGSALIDGEALAKMVRSEYYSAGIRPEDITVGAVIITGESSRKDNAQEIVHALGSLAGDFVVASAGPDLEGIIAGRGAGAARLSKEKHCLTANVDIGGGTANIAVFDDGVPVDTACFDIGGRQIRFEEGSSRVAYINPKTERLCTKLGLDIALGRECSPTVAEELCRHYTRILAEALGVLPAGEDPALMLTDHPLKQKRDLSYVTFSGGVGDVFYNEDKFPEPMIFGDIGVFFGKALKKYWPPSLCAVRPDETIRATVIGAGAFTASLSGSTVDAQARHLLPLKNLPVVKLSPQEERLDAAPLLDLLIQKVSWVRDSASAGLVLAFTMESSGGYERLKVWAEALVDLGARLEKEGLALAVIIENDYAKALGQIMRMRRDFAFIVLDGVKVQDGDFVDIGHPLMGNTVVPLVVKSLIFNS